MSIEEHIQKIIAERDELKTQLEQLREQLYYMAQQHRCGCGHPACNRCYDDKQNAETLAATPAQCLAEIKAQAVIDAINAHKNNLLTFDFDTAIRVTDLIRYANQLRQRAEATDQTPEQSLVSVSDARQFDVRGYSWAIASNDGGVIASGSQPALAAKSETNTLGYLMDYSDRVGGDLYLAPTDLKNFDPIDTNNLIMGMTWDQLNAKQQGKALPSAIKSKMPSGAVKVYANGKLIGDSLSRQMRAQKGNQLRQQAKGDL